MSEKEYQKADQATFNIRDNRFKLYFPEGERLPADEYKEARDLKFQFYHGQKCFSAIWSPKAEDFVLRYVDQVQEDDSPDDIEGRVARYQKYAERSEQSAQEAQNRQTNTDRQAKQAENTAEHEIEKAQHWQNRIAGAIQTASHKDRPQTIINRIKKIKAQSRRQQKNIEDAQAWLTRWESGKLINKETQEEASPQRRAIYYANYDQATPSRMWSDLRDDEMQAEEATGIMIRTHQHRIEYNNRWLNHLARRVEFETAYLVAVGGSEDMLKPKPRRKAVAPKDGLTKGQEIYYPFGAQGYLRAKILTLSAKSARIEFLDEKYLHLNRDKGHQAWRIYIKQELPV